MDANLLGDLLDNHGMQAFDSSFEEFALASNDNFAGANNRILALLYIAEELDCRLVTLLDILADIPVDRLLAKHAAIAFVESQSRHVLFVHDYDVFFVTFDESHIRLDKTGFNLVVALARPGVERTDEVHRFIYSLRRAAAQAYQFAHVFLLQ